MWPKRLEQAHPGLRFQQQNITNLFNGYNGCTLWLTGTSFRLLFRTELIISMFSNVCHTGSCGPWIHGKWLADTNSHNTILIIVYSDKSVQELGLFTPDEIEVETKYECDKFRREIWFGIPSLGTEILKSTWLTNNFVDFKWCEKAQTEVTK